MPPPPLSPFSISRHFLLVLQQKTPPQTFSSINSQYRSLTTTKILTPTITLITRRDDEDNLSAVAMGTKNDISMATASSSKTNKNVTMATAAESTNSPPTQTAPPRQKPLSLLLCWLRSKPSAVSKYANFYLDQGFDVLTVRITPAQLLWPTLSNRIVENELMPILKQANYNKSLIHGFSVGGYVFGQMLRVAHQDLETYSAILTSLKGQIWDSVVDINGTSLGVSKSIFPHSKILQKSLFTYINFHMSLLHSVATKHYYISHEYFYNKPLKAPALFLCSEKDQISTMDVIQDVQNLWEKNFGIKCTTKLWENTQHVGHFYKHPEEYKRVVTGFIKEIGIQEGEGQKIREDENLDVRKAGVFEAEINNTAAAAVA